MIKVTVQEVEGGYTIHSFDLAASPCSTDHVRLTLKEAVDLAYEILKNGEK